MNDKIRNLLDQITALEDDLRSAVQEQEGKLRYTIDGTSASPLSRPCARRTLSSR